MMSAPDSVPLFRSPFIFLRHGETETNRLGLIAGSTDVELNEAGWQQARRAAELLKMTGIDAIHSSPLQRARDTAACVAAVITLGVAIVPGLAERGWGELEGKSRELRVRGVTPKGGESLEAFTARTLAGLKNIPLSRLPLIVAHSGTFRVLSNALRIAPSSDVIENSQPMRFVPPRVGGGNWKIEML